MAKYVMVEMNDLNSTGERRSYPKIELQGQVTVKELASAISGSSSFSTGDVMGLMQAVVERVAEELGSGRSVKIEGLGIFRASLSLKKGKEPEVADKKERRNAQSIKVGGVNFSPDKAFVQNVNSNFHPERSEKKNKHSSTKYTRSERLGLALDYLHRHPYLKVADYCLMTGLLTAAAAKELRFFSEDRESGIDRTGWGTHIMYIKQQKKNDEV